MTTVPVLTGYVTFKEGEYISKFMPLGTPVAVRLTVPEKPPKGFTYRSSDGLLEGPTLKVRVDGVTVKAWFTTERNRVVDADNAPEVPVMTTLALPSEALLLAVSVRTLVPVVETGLKEAVTPLGSPDADKFTAAVNPP